MKRCWLLSLALVCSSVWSTPGAAQSLDVDLSGLEAPCAPEVTATRRAAVVHEGQAGIWFERQVALCILQRMEVLSLVARRVHLLDERLQIGEERHALMQRQVEVSQRSEHVAVEALQSAERRAREATEEAGQWYRHPAFWFTAGVVVTVLLEIAAIFAFQSLTR